jgi:FtsH-binding integral membrane protein
MPVIRVKDGKSKKAGKIIAAVAVVVIAASSVLYALDMTMLSVYICVAAGSVCSAYSVFDQN